MNHIEPLLISIFWGAVALYFSRLDLIPTGTDGRDLNDAPQTFVLKTLRAVGANIRPMLSETTLQATKAALIRGGVKMRPEDFVASKLLSPVIFALVGFLFDVNIDTTPLFAMAFFVLGLFYPRMWLNGKIMRRQRRIFRELPDLLDTLRLAVSAGLDFSSALRIVTETIGPGPLLDEFQQVDQDIALGTTRSHALQSMADRCGMNEIESFVMAIRQADQLGASLEPVLSVQSEIARQRRWQVAEVIVGKLPTKLLGPLVLCIFPASFIILFTPLVLDYMASGF